MDKLSMKDNQQDTSFEKTFKELRLSLK